MTQPTRKDVRKAMWDYLNVLPDNSPLFKFIAAWNDVEAINNGTVIRADEYGDLVGASECMEAAYIALSEAVDDCIRCAEYADEIAAAEKADYDRSAA